MANTAGSVGSSRRLAPNSDRPGKGKAGASELAAKVKRLYGERTKRALKAVSLVDPAMLDVPGLRQWKVAGPNLLDLDLAWNKTPESCPGRPPSFSAAKGPNIASNSQQAPVV